MAHITLDLAHRYAEPTRRTSVRAAGRVDEPEAAYALQPLRIEFAHGGAYALLGPSGCGKTTMLNLISGLLTPSQGTVHFDGVDVTAQTPQQRNIAHVFQFPVVYDTMTVAENLAFPLRNRGVPAPQQRARVGMVAELLDLSAQLDQSAAGVSADAKQRISLGRGLVREDVSAVLFDEPLTVIDPALKWRLRRTIKRLHAELHLTLLYVTHDQVEALTFADDVLVMSMGRVVQRGSATDLFERPAHTFVGDFIGSPGMNFLPAFNAADPTHHADPFIMVAGVRVPLDAAHGSFPTGDFTLGIRPEHVTLADAHAAGAMPAMVTQRQDVGTYWLLTARAGTGDAACTVRVRVPADHVVPAPGDAVWLRVVDRHSGAYVHDHRVPDHRVPDHRVPDVTP